MNVSLSLMSSLTYLREGQRTRTRNESRGDGGMYLSSLATISHKTSCRVRSRGPKLETRSSSAPSLHEAGGMTLPVAERCEYGVPERRDWCMEAASP